MGILQIVLRLHQETCYPVAVNLCCVAVFIYCLL